MQDNTLPHSRIGDARAANIAHADPYVVGAHVFSALDWSGSGNWSDFDYVLSCLRGRIDSKRLVHQLIASLQLMGKPDPEHFSIRQMYLTACAVAFHVKHHDASKDTTQMFMSFKLKGSDRDSVKIGVWSDGPKTILETTWRLSPSGSRYNDDDFVQDDMNEVPSEAMTHTVCDHVKDDRSSRSQRSIWPGVNGFKRPLSYALGDPSSILSTHNFDDQGPVIEGVETKEGRDAAIYDYVPFRSSTQDKSSYRVDHIRDHVTMRDGPRVEFVHVFDAPQGGIKKIKRFVPDIPRAFHALFDLDGVASFSAQALQMDEDTLGERVNAIITHLQSRLG